MVPLVASMAPCLHAHSVWARGQHCKQSVTFVPAAALSLPGTALKVVMKRSKGMQSRSQVQLSLAIVAACTNTLCETKNMDMGLWRLGRVYRRWRNGGWLAGDIALEKYHMSHGTKKQWA